jgi:hypothetical protein
MTKIYKVFPSSSVGRSVALLMPMSYVRTVPGEPNLALLSLMAEVLFCKQGVRVRFLQGAPLI